MTAKGLGIFGMGLLLAATAMMHAPGRPATTSITPREHGPMRLHAPDIGGTHSENWAGYAVTGKDFTYANGSWHVPQVDCTKTPDTFSSFWVGLDGFSDATVEQIGTESDCSGTTAKYYAWYQLYPAGQVVLGNFPVSPGNKIGAQVQVNVDGDFIFHIENFTTGQDFTTTQSAPGAKRTSAEWIAEAPSNTKGGIEPLADFGRANYGKDYNASDPDSCIATDSTITNGPIAAYGADVQKIIMFSSTNVVEAVPTALTPDGAAFRVNWKAE